MDELELTFVEEAVKKIAQHNIYLTGPLAETDGK